MVFAFLIRLFNFVTPKDDFNFYKALELILTLDNNNLAPRIKSCFIRPGYTSLYSNGITSFSFSDKHVIKFFLLKKDQ